MTTIAIDAVTGDLAVSGNSLVLVEGADEVLQRVRGRLRMIRGEWFLEPSKGTPYREIIWVKGVTPTRAAAAIKREIVTTSGVLELLAYDQTYDQTLRKLSVTFTARATDGTIFTLTEDL